MSDPSHPGAAALPQFYAGAEPLDRNRHAGLRLRPHAGFGFAASAVAVPLLTSEFALAAVSMPIVFAGEDRPRPVAVTGLRAGRNLFVEPDGAWARNVHIPAHLRRTPFLLMTAPAREGEAEPRLLLGIDPHSPRFSEDPTEPGAAPLFVDGEPSPETLNARDFCLAHHRDMEATNRAADALAEAGLLIAQHGKVELPDGEVLRLTDFKVVDEAKLNALPDAELGRLRACGALAAAYCHLVSLNSFPALSARLAAQG
ncbi:MAG: SapC family protein [Pseudomonadota bacterium]|nr:SapC family protein [Pseudomonadota bacterium]MEE3100315.1 SapC family protein [Pseudomonadota bacterium]